MRQKCCCDLESVNQQHSNVNNCFMVHSEHTEATKENIRYIFIRTEGGSIEGACGLKRNF